MKTCELITQASDSRKQCIKPGDFIQSDNHLGDVFFEVVSASNPTEEDGYWSISYITYDKYCGTPRKTWINSANSIRKFYPAEMAIPVMMFKRQRYRASFGQYDPFYGFAPVGTPLRYK